MTNIVACFFKDLHTQFSASSKELISTWAKSWSDRGWEAIVLGEADAINHPKYDNSLWNDRSNLVYGCNPSDPQYIKTCYERWFAYDNLVQTHSLIHWADYDVINYSYYDKNLNTNNPCRFDPSYCCGILDKTKSSMIVNSIIKYANSTPEQFSNLKLPNNNDMHLLHRLQILKLTHICANPLNNRINYDSSSLVHFHGGLMDKYINGIDLKNKTRLQIIESLRPL